MLRAEEIGEKLRTTCDPKLTQQTFVSLNRCVRSDEQWSAWSNLEQGCHRLRRRHKRVRFPHPAKRKHEQKKRQVVVVIKEIKMRVSTDEHDFQTKLRHIKKFLEEGDKVKVSIRFRGREMAHMNLGHDRMKRVVEEVKGLGEPESFPKMEERQLFMMLVPGKKKAAPAAAAEPQKTLSAAKD